MKIFNKKHLNFIFYNLIFIVLSISIIFYLTNGNGNLYPFDLVGISIIIAIPIVILQYPLLIIKTNWIYRTAIFYLSMLVYLFILGVILFWRDEVGNNISGIWIARFEAGIKLMIYGQLFGGLLGFSLVWFINYLLSEKLIGGKQKKQHRNKGVN